MIGDLLTPIEVSGLLRLSLATVRLYIWDGRLPVVRLGRRTLVPRKELEKWLDGNFKPAKAEY